MYHLDFETYSECDIKELGHFAYAEHPTTRILLCAIAHDDGPVHLWDHSDPDPEIEEMIREMAEGDELI